MIKLIDTNKIEIPEGFFNDLNVPKFFRWLKDLPTADVVPKSEYADMEIRALRAEKQLATQQDLAESRKKDIEHNLSEIEKLQEAWFKKEDTMQMIVKEHQDELQKAKSEVVREIIGEILLNHTPDIDGFFTMHESELAELKKKYTDINQRKEDENADR